MSKEPKIIFVDIDQTIADNTVKGDYTTSFPIPENIEKVNKLYDDGHRIVYWTARGANTGIDWRELTHIQLETWGAKHHELRLDKPFYDLFIDDKTISSVKDLDD